MTAIKTTESYSVNQAANACNISQQEFRQFVGEFERQTRAYLPKDSEGRKRIPGDILDIFQRAVLWSKIDQTAPSGGMLKALEKGQQYRLHELARAVADTRELILASRKLEKMVAELREVNSRARPITIDHAGVEEIASALTLGWRWQSAGVVLLFSMICLLLGFFLGRFL